MWGLRHEKDSVSNTVNHLQKPMREEIICGKGEPTDFVPRNSQIDKLPSKYYVSTYWFMMFSILVTEVFNR